MSDDYWRLEMDTDGFLASAVVADNDGGHYLLLKFGHGALKAKQQIRMLILELEAMSKEIKDDDK